MQTELEIAELLKAQGLYGLGEFDCDGQTAELVGNVGSGLWAAFSTSNEFSDDLPDPLNRWTINVVERAVQQGGAGLVREVRYPFGDRVWPFQAYARQAMGISQSPIGLLIHRKYGLWTAFRAVIVFNRPFAGCNPPEHVSPCDSCFEKPCLNTCPIEAFTSDGYDYPSCKQHVASERGQDCYFNGCRARLACPVGREHHYLPEHQAFHMRAFVGK